MNDKIYCELDTSFFEDQGYVLAFCEDSDIEVGCGWMSRAVNSAPSQESGIQILEFRQLEELNALHQMAWRTPEAVEDVRVRAEKVRQEYQARIASEARDE